MYELAKLFPHSRALLKVLACCLFGSMLPVAPQLVAQSSGESSVVGAASETLNLEPGQIAIEYIAHACFRIQSSSGKRIIIDPYASRVWLGYDFPNGLEADAILITHPHYDHDAGHRIGKPFPWPTDVPVFREPGNYAVGDISIKGVKGKHADPYGKEFGQINTLWVVTVGGIKIAHLGDNGPLTARNVEELGPVDILMIPIDALYHILKETEIQAIRAVLKPKILIPMHYRIPNLEQAVNRPKDLGPIDPWLEKKKNVVRVKNNIRILSGSDLPRVRQIMVFLHSPSVPIPN